MYKTFIEYLKEDGEVVTTTGNVDGNPTMLFNKVATRKQLGESKHEFASCQFLLDKALTDKVLEYSKYLIRPENIYLPEQGYINDPHITLKYGLHTDNCSEVFTVIEDELLQPTYIDILETSIFECDDFDVVYLRVESQKLIDMNLKLCYELDNTNTQSEYNPHITLAYIKKGTGEKYKGKTEMTEHQVKLSKFQFSNKEGETIDFY